MRNSHRRSGVYSYMLRLPLLLICSLAAWPQPHWAQQAPQQDPINAAIQTVWQARSEGRFEDAAAAREQARSLLQHAPVDAPQYQGWVQQVSQAYQSSGMNLQARAVLQEALARTAPLGNSHPAHAGMLNALAESWWQDGSLLKAAGYLEQAAAAQAEAPPPPKDQAVAAGRFTVSGGISFSRLVAVNGFGAGPFNSSIYTYTRLADLYQQLGRSDAVAAVAAKIRTLAASDPTALARFYEQRGQLADAAAIYQKTAEQSADPQMKASAWQALASLDQRQERYSDAAAALQQAIAAMESSDQPGMRDQTQWIRQSLARTLGQAGQPDQGDRIFQQLLHETTGEPQAGQMLMAYAQYLADTRRAPQAESLLKEYAAGAAASQDSQQQANVYFTLANLAGRSGNAKGAESYQKEARALQPQPTPPGGQSIEEDVRKTNVAFNDHRLDDAYDLALHILDIAPQAADRYQVEWFIPNVANQLAANKQPAKAEQLFQRLFTLMETWQVDNVQHLITVSQNYTQFLMGQKDRWNEVPAALEKYRDLLASSNGADSGTLAQPLRMKLEFQRSHSQWEPAQSSGRELLELQESLSGNTSDPYLRDLLTVARVYTAAGDPTTALPLYRKAIAIADLVSTPNNDWNRPATRMETAQILASLKQFDEAVKLAEEAVAVAKAGPNPQPYLSQQLEQIRQMKQQAGGK
jgi:truncated hemoglobin YjbI